MIKRHDTYSAVCDWPGCTRDVMDPTDYSGGDMTMVQNALEDGDWWIGARAEEAHDFGLTGGRHYCNNHPAAWASDHENGEPFPEPPYLLIHDGDTGNSEDDGKVSLILPPFDLGTIRDGAE